MRIIKMETQVKELYVRKAKMVKIIDGDTFDAEIDLGFGIQIKRRIRLFGVDCPEMKGSTKEKGEEARQFTIKFFEETNNEFLILSHTDKVDNFGRILVEVWNKSGDKNLAGLLIDNKMAKVFIR